MKKIASSPFKYLHGYPEQTLAQVQQLVAGPGIGPWLKARHPHAHGVRTDKALFEYVQTLKQDAMRGGEPISKVLFDSKLQVVAHALGTHTTIARVQGNKLKAKREIRIAALFKDVPDAFLKMITVHELAHLKERAHDKAFYKLCTHMEPSYHQLEFELRLYLTHLDATGQPLWREPGPSPTPP